MKLSDVQKIARTKGIKFDPKVQKPELIKTIQKAEGNFECFGTALNYCDQSVCMWKDDCLKKQ